MSRFFDRVRRVSRRQQRSFDSERRVVFWVRRCSAFHGTHPQRLDPDAIRAFLDDLRAADGVTQPLYQEAVEALRFLHESVLDNDPGQLARLPDCDPGKATLRVLSRQEIGWLLDEIDEPAYLVVLLLYGAGLRLREALALRHRDVDVDAQRIRVAGGEDPARETLLPAAAIDDLESRLEENRRLFESDREADVRFGAPATAGFEAYWLFPASEPVDGRRTTLDPDVVEDAIRRAVEDTGIETKATSATFRHSFAAHLLGDGADPQRVQRLLGHGNLEMTLRYREAVASERSTVTAADLQVL